MKKYLTFLVGSLLTAAIWFVLWLAMTRLVTHSGQSLQSGLWTALLFGFAFQLFNLWVDRRTRSGKLPHSPILMIAVGLMGLGTFVWLGWFGEARPVGIELFWLIVLLVPPIFLLVGGILMLVQRRTK